MAGRDAVRGSRRVDVGPESRDLECVVSDPQVVQDVLGSLIYRVNELTKLDEPVKFLVELPSPSWLGLWSRAPHRAEPRYDALVDPLKDLVPEIVLPNERRKQA